MATTRRRDQRFSAIAETGTLMCAGPDTPATVSLPRTVALVPVERIVPFMEDARTRRGRS
jgi:L-lactate utilization protein LutC